MHARIMASDTEQQKKQTQDQKTVLTRILFAGILLFCFGVMAVYLPFPKPRLPTLLDRVVFTLRWLIVSLLSIHAGVQWIATTRFTTSAINPLDRSGTKYVEMRSKILQNTVEQFLLHAFSLIVLSTYLSEESMYWIPLLVVLFVIARVVFAVGYSMDPLKRAYGFAMTFTPTVVVIIYCLYCLFMYGFDVYH